MSSSRLPGKVLMKLDRRGTTSLGLMVKRIRSGDLLSRTGGILAVVTSVDKCDDVIASYCRELHVYCLRGPRDNVLERYFQSASALSADTIIRLTADCPFIDVNEISNVLRAYEQGECDYCTNSYDGTRIADGFDVEVFSMKILERAYRYATSDHEKEHVTIWMAQQGPQTVKFVENSEDNSDCRLTLDTPYDKRVIESILEGGIDIYHSSMSTIVSHYRAKSLVKYNGMIGRNSGWSK